jgi:hemerythrin superfamily protein
MNISAETLEIYNKEIYPFNEKKVKMFATEEIKWAKEKIQELVEEYVSKVK